MSSNAPDPVLDPVLLNDPLNGRANKKNAPKDAPYAGDLLSARVVIRDLLDQATGSESMDDILERATPECRRRGVDLGEEHDHVLARAYVIEKGRATTTGAARRGRRIPRTSESRA
jgi:hypothetical protein